MASRADHYRAAELLLEQAQYATQHDYEENEWFDARRARILAAAQVFATLAGVSDVVAAQANAPRPVES